MNLYRTAKSKLFLAGSVLTMLSIPDAGSQTVTLSELSDFRSPSPNWQLASAVACDPSVKYHLKVTGDGKGVLVNKQLDDPKQAKDIYSIFEHGDADIELEFMMAKESNSGIYLQGRYEIQLLDSWGKRNPSAGDCGGIYERWDESRPDGQKGYQGYAPRQNASRIPGVWQKMKISFQAPRFNQKGEKIENARILSIYLNDLLIHENVELTGPTRGGMNNNEVAKGPLRFQGDHGPVAFRNIQIKPFETPKPVLKDLRYTLYDGRVLKKEDITGAKLVKEGKNSLIDYTVSTLTNNYVLKYSGKISIPVKGLYRFNGAFWGGYGNLIIDGKEVFPFSSWHQTSREVELPAGDLPFEYIYSKVNEGDKPGFGLLVSGPGIRMVSLHEVGSVTSSRASNPIYLEAGRETVLHRSFIDFNGKRLPYGLSAGTPVGVNYSMNLATGSLLRVWRGSFLNVTPMWLDRGNGTSVPHGSVLNLTDASQFSRINGSPAEGYVFKGYTVDDFNNPVFSYIVSGQRLLDRINPDVTGKYLERSITSQSEGVRMSLAVASGKEIERQANGLFLVDGAYFIKVGDGSEARIETRNDGKVVTVEGTGKVSYAILW